MPFRNHPAADGAWITPTLNAPWANYGAFGFPGAAYRRDGNVVRLRGLVKSGVVGTVLFQLPAGFRPAGTAPGGSVFLVSTDTTPARLDVTGDGNVTWIVGGSSAYFSLDGVTFVVEQ